MIATTSQSKLIIQKRIIKKVNRNHGTDKIETGVALSSFWRFGCKKLNIQIEQIQTWKWNSNFEGKAVSNWNEFSNY